VWIQRLKTDPLAPLPTLNPDIIRAYLATVAREAERQLMAHFHMRQDSAYDHLSPALRHQVDLALQQNVALIRGLRETTRARVQRVLQQAELQQLTTAGTAELLASATELLPRRAVLIARDQTLKLQGSIVEARSRELGSNSYTWDTSNDSRVRPDHRRLNGTHHTWDDPPVVDRKTGRRANPGGDFNCRCIAVPDEIDFSAPARPAARASLAPAPVAAPASVPSEKLGAIGQEVFGQALSDADLATLMGSQASLPAGLKLDVINVRESERKRAVQLTGRITDAKGEQVALLSRDFEPGGVVKHATFFIEDKFQGKGIGAQIFNAQIDAYRQSGLVKKVKLSAAEVGRYVWTQAGFQWNAKDTAELLGHLHTKLSETLAPEAVGKIMTHVHTAQDVANLEVAGKRVGKELLVNYPVEAYSTDMSQDVDKIRRL